MEEKELIILAVYVNIENQTKVQVQQCMGDIIANYQTTFDDIKNKNIKTLFFPINQGLTRVECIYPIANTYVNSEVESQLISLYKAIINSSDEELQDIVNDLERKLKIIKLKGDE